MVSTKKARPTGGFQFSRMSSVVSHKSSRHLLAGMVLLAVLALIMILMLFGQHSAHVVSHRRPVQKADAALLAQSAREMAALAQQKWQHQSATHHNRESRQYRARENAPTRVYEAASMRQTAPQHQAWIAGKGRFAQYVGQQPSSPNTVKAHKIAHPEKTILSVEFIHAVLETEINIELPGMVRAVVSRPVYSYVGSHILIPAGSRLIGQYTDMLNNGASSARVFIVWNRVITPAGVSVMINSPNVDALGRSGQGANAISHHFMRIFGQAILLSILGAGVSSYGVNSTDQPNSADAYRQAIAQAFQQSSNQVLQQTNAIKPTLHVYQGQAINIFVAHDLLMD